MRLIKPIASLYHDCVVCSIAVSRNGTRVLSGSVDTLVRIWDVRTGSLVLQPLRGHTSGVNSVAISTGGTRIVSGSTDITVRMWGAQTGASIGEPLTGHSDRVRSVSFSPDSTRIISGSLDGTIQIWDTQTRTVAGKLFMGSDYQVESVAFSPDSTRVVAASRQSIIRIASYLYVIDYCSNQASPNDLACSARSIPVVEAATPQHSTPPGCCCIPRCTWHGIIMDGARKSETIHRAMP